MSTTQLEAPTRVDGANTYDRLLDDLRHRTYPLTAGVCPRWCAGNHLLTAVDPDDGHMGGDEPITLTLEKPIERFVGTIVPVQSVPQEIHAVLLQDLEDTAPIITLFVGEGPRVKLTRAEASALAGRLLCLAAQPGSEIQRAKDEATRQGLRANYAAMVIDGRLNLRRANYELSAHRIDPLPASSTRRSSTARKDQS